jgi:hypothetical protein
MALSVGNERDRRWIASVRAAKSGHELTQIQLQIVRSNIQCDVVENRRLYRLSGIAHGRVWRAGIENGRAHRTGNAPVSWVTRKFASGAAVDRGIPWVDRGTDE